VCSNQCGGQGDSAGWCNNWRKVEEEVRRCADHTSGGQICTTGCDNAGEDYSWCAFGGAPGAWDYCALPGLTTHNVSCVGPCTQTHNWWCRTDSKDQSKWDYCTPSSQELVVHYNAHGQECTGECMNNGTEYWWCWKPQRWSGKHADINWSYCSQAPGITTNNQPCLDECATRGQDYFWCNIAGDTWDYCSPPSPASSTPPMTSDGRRCMGVCDYYSSSYQYCPGLYENRGSWWHYCGVGSSDHLYPRTMINILVLKFFFWNLS